MTQQELLCECHQEPMGWSKDARSKLGGNWFCRVRQRETKARWREANPEKVREKWRRRRDANPEKLREKDRRYREANREKILEYGKRYREANPDKFKRYYAANPERFREAQRRWRAANPHYKYAYRYGLTLDAYDALLKKQSGTCAICGSVPNGKPLEVDHDHSCCPGTKTCGRCVRGFLCHACNVALGLFSDDVERLQKAIRYLAQSGVTTNEPRQGAPGSPDKTRF